MGDMSSWSVVATPAWVRWSNVTIRKKGEKWHSNSCEEGREESIKPRDLETYGIPSWKRDHLLTIISNLYNFTSVFTVRTFILQNSYIISFLPLIASMFVQRVAWRHWLICSPFERQCSCSLPSVEVMAMLSLQTWRVRRETIPDIPPTQNKTRRWPWLPGVWQAHSSLIAQFPSFAVRTQYDLVDTLFNTITMQ